MTNEISNKTLAFLLVGAIVVSLFGTFISLNKLNRLSDFGFGGITGFVTETGTVTLNVSGLQSFLVNTNVDFGAIVPNESGYWISTNTDNGLWAGVLANDCTDATPTGLCHGMVIENDGNDLLNISFNSTQNAASLIGGTSPSAPSFTFLVRDGNQSGTGNENGCSSGTIPNPTWTEITLLTDYVICNGTAGTGFNYTATADKVTIEYNLTIPADAPQASGSQATITVFNT